MTTWTVIVQHSGYGYGGNIEFSRGLETRQVQGPEATKILNAGGVVFGPSMGVMAMQYADNEPYPDGYEGLIPRVPGTFHPTLKVDGLAVYLPPKENKR